MRVNKKLKSVIATTICAFSCVVAGVGFAIGNNVDASADTATYFCDGASVRIANDGKNGIRFHVRMEKEQYDALGLSELTTGTLVIPKDKLGASELNIGGATTGYNGAKAANVVTTGEWTEITVATGTYMESVVYMYDIPESAYGRDFAFRGYYVDGNGAYQYTEDTDVRSLSTVAAFAKYYAKSSSDEYFAANRAVTTFANADDYLYRVGNENAVSLTSLFTAAEEQGFTIGETTITPEYKLEGVTVENVSGDATGTVADDLTTVRFEGTGVVKVTVDEAYSAAKTLYLEVVDATNVTAYSELGNRNSVLLNDITMSSGSSYYLSGATLYGNGFTFDVSDGDYTGTGSVSNNYLVYLSNAALDNVKLVGAVYTTYGAQVKDAYNRPVVLSVGNSTIANSYISNCAAPVRVNGGNLEIVNSTLKGGNFANLDIRNGNVVLDNVTTINQVNGNDTADDGTVVVGLGVVVYYENVLSTTTVTVNNGITQYNHLSETQADTYITDTYASKLMDVMFGSTCSALQYSDGSDTWVNTGILSMIDAVGDSNISDVDGYVEASPTMTGVTGYVHTSVPTAESIAATVPEYATAGQYEIAPAYSFDYTTKNYVAKTDGSNDYCYEDNGTVLISMDVGDTFNWDTSILTATKGDTLSYTVSMNGADYTGKSIAFNTAGRYEVVYTYTDSNNYGMDENGGVSTYDKTYTKTVHISVSVVAPEAKHATFTFGSSNAATEKITVNNNTYISATGVTADNSTWTYMMIGDQNIYYPIVAAKLTSTKGSSSYAYFPVFENVVTITDYKNGGIGDAFTYNSSTTTLPSTLTAVKGVYKEAADVTSWSNLTDGNLTQSGASNIFKWASASSAGSDPEVYNNVLCYKSPNVSADRVAYITLVQYSYTDSTNTTYYYYVGYTLEAFTKSSTCVTGDTLVTLADGTQKRIDALTGDETFLVWNFRTGEYDEAPASILMNHGYDTVNVTELIFEDGTTVKTINGHGFFDTATNEFVLLDEYNVAEYIGHEFVKVDGDGYATTKLVGYDVSEQYTEVWSVLTAEQYNCILEGMWTVTAAEVENSPAWLMPYEVGEDMKYDEAAMQADIEKYGLYTYEDFEAYCSYEQFAAFGFENFKVSVGKGYITWDEIIYLIELHLG
ncbi:MAG: hypothetical protein IJX91_02595 [Clostridia bacterium]|nr:hypothetical protein [Clostridia bacterium]